MTNSKQPLPAEDTPVELLLEAQKSRRWFNGTLAAVVGGAALFEADQFVTDWHWNSQKTEVLPLPGCADMCADPDWWEEEIWLGCPGMAHKSGLPVARAMDGALRAVDQKRLSMFVNLSDKGLDASTYPTILHSLQSRCDRISIGGQSMGGIAPIEGARVLRNAFGAQFGRLALIGTPFRMKNVREEYVADILAKVGRIYPGGIGGSMAANVVDDAKKDRRAFLGDIFGSLAKTAKRTWEEDSPHIALSGLVLLDQIDMAHNWRDVKRAFGEGTKIAFVGSGLDDVVDCEMALEDWGNFAADVGSDFEHYWSERTKHANVEVAGDKLRPWMREV